MCWICWILHIQQAIGPHEDLLTVGKRRRLQWYARQSAFLYLELFSLAAVHSLPPTGPLPFLAFQQVSGTGVRGATGIPSLFLLVAGLP